MHIAHLPRVHNALDLTSCSPLRPHPKNFSWKKKDLSLWLLGSFKGGSCSLSWLSHLRRWKWPCSQGSWQCFSSQLPKGNHSTSVQGSPIFSPPSATAFSIFSVKRIRWKLCSYDGAQCPDSVSMCLHSGAKNTPPWLPGLLEEIVTFLALTH